MPKSARRSLAVLFAEERADWKLRQRRATIFNGELLEIIHNLPSELEHKETSWSLESTRLGRALDDQETKSSDLLAAQDRAFGAREDTYRQEYETLRAEYEAKLGSLQDQYDYLSHCGRQQDRDACAGLVDAFALGEQLLADERYSKAYHKATAETLRAELAKLCGWMLNPRLEHTTTSQRTVEVDESEEKGESDEVNSPSPGTLTTRDETDDSDGEPSSGFQFGTEDDTDVMDVR